MTAAFLAFSVSAESAEQRGVTDGEIRIGQTMPYSGALSAYSALGKAEIAYFNLVNERGGINGRKIKLISLDDGYVPPRSVEQTRRLVESDDVALIFSSLGTAQNNAIAKYLQASAREAMLRAAQKGEDCATLYDLAAAKCAALVSSPISLNCHRHRRNPIFRP